MKGAPVVNWRECRACGGQFATHSNRPTCSGCREKARIALAASKAAALKKVQAKTVKEAPAGDRTIHTGDKRGSVVESPAALLAAGAAVVDCYGRAWEPIEVQL